MSSPCKVETAAARYAADDDEENQTGESDQDHYHKGAYYRKRGRTREGREGREKKRKGSEREEEVYKRQVGWKGECAL